MKEIVVEEKIVVKEPVTTGEVVALPGIKGDKGDAFTYDDFTPEQIADLKRPATEAAAVAIAAAKRAEAAAESVQSAVEDAEQAAQSAQQAATAAQEAVKNANKAVTKAEQAISNANEASEIANQAAANANQAAENVDGRVTSLEEKASQVYENLAAIEASGDTNPNKIYIDGETMQPYIYKNGEFLPFKGGNVVQDPNNIPFYTCRYDDEFAVPINEADLTDVIVFRDTYGTNVERIKNGKSVWRIAQSIIYLDSSFKGRLNETLLIIDNYLYFRSKPYGVYKISLEDGTYINNRTPIQNCEAIVYLNNNIYAFGDTNKLAILNKDDLSLIEEITFDQNFYGYCPLSYSYEDRCIVLLQKKAVIIKDNGENQEFEFEYGVISGFYIPKTTYVNAPFYVFVTNGKIRTVSEDLVYDYMSNSQTTIQNTLLGYFQEIDLNSPTSYRLIHIIGSNGYYSCVIPGSYSISIINGTTINTKNSIIDGDIKWTGGIYKTKSGRYIIRKGNTMYKVFSLI